MNNTVIPIGKYVVDKEIQQQLFRAFFPEKYPTHGKKRPDTKKGYPTNSK